MICKAKERLEEKLNENEQFSILAHNTINNDWVDVFYIYPKEHKVIHSYKTVLWNGKKVHIEHAKKYKKLVIQKMEDASISFAFIISAKRQEEEIIFNILVTGKVLKVN